METKVHNINFYKTEPLGINCLALNGKQLALSRTDATIEIWSLVAAPILVKVIPGEENASVEALGWFGKRLLSTGLAGTLIEWDLTTLTLKNSVILTGYAAWCLDVSHENALVSVGTEQGYINLYKINENDFLYEKLFDKQEGRIICCKFSKRGDILATGSEGIIRLWNVKTGQAMQRMVLSQRGKNNLVWDVALLSDMTLISADSTGKLTVWDANIGEQIEAFSTHRQDILTLCVSDSEAKVYCSGVDPLIVSLVKVQIDTKNNSSSSWVKDVQRHIHEHDVRCLALDGEKLISAGADGYLTLSSFPPKWLMRLPPMVPHPRAAACSNTKLVLLRFKKHLEVWRLGCYRKSKKGQPVILSNQKLSKVENKSKGVEEDSLSKVVLKTIEESGSKNYIAIEKNPIKLISLSSKKNKSITSCAISPNGTFFAYSTEIHLGIFKLEVDGESQMMSKVLPLPDGCKNVMHMIFTDANTLILNLNNKLIILHIDDSAGGVIQQSISVTEHLKGDIFKIVSSSTGSYLAVTDCNGCIALWLRKQKFTPKKVMSSQYIHLTSLPRCSALITAMTFDKSEETFIAVCADQKIIEFDLKKLRVDTSMNSKLPASWNQRQSAVEGVFFHPTCLNVLVFYDLFSLWIINRNDFIDKTKKRTKVNQDSEPNQVYKVKILPFKYLAAFQFIEEDEALAVQLSPETILSQLPPMFEVKRHVAL